ncbi:glycoside hydrolase family 2 protein [Sphingobacterium faecale]|uniref:Beta-galactosidase n=1 Tax=Sphingobacterium faecale TaxID=2803775 RepID=A0ABS1R3I7_9SPHI|nr:sugar-binding domain-containing protein [Sphingobacterium faecale]MBL1409280.1 beta-galactosidase [Sphingobacterium faecale]
MMKFLLFSVLMIVVSLRSLAQDWKPIDSHILTSWGENLSSDKPHPEYPRPQLIRTNNWQNLNGLWKYAIRSVKSVEIPSQWDGNILVPFAIESALSGVGLEVGKDNVLWYNNSILLNKLVNKNKVLLHFGAVDWQCDVFINNKLVGRHEGGFDPFSMDISAFLNKGNKQDITIRVWDPTDDGPQPRGKQVKNPHGIWYTPVTGIWQTVWVESVPETYIANTKQTPHLDKGSLSFQARVESSQPDDRIKVIVLDGETIILEQSGEPNTEFELLVPGLQPWSPTNPKLYDLKIQLIRKGKVIDNTKSYFAMRKISMKKDQQGIQRLLLNNEFCFQYGPLDQGWWPDGLHTAPSDDALKYDIIKTKEMGFNMIRKHIKIEPARWYRHCDSIGMLVWQDMPSGDLGGNHWDMQPGKISAGNRDKERSSVSEAYYRKEWKAIMECLHNFPSIVMWVPFNEAWGQFKTKEITEWTIAYDPSRLVNSASGGNFMATGDILDIHNYPDAAMPDPSLFGAQQALVLGEFGGLGLPIEGHTWQQKNNWGYQSFKNKSELLDRYKGLIHDLSKLISMGLSAAVYTQTTDVEIETNGLMTYDRKVTKIPENDLNTLHQTLYKVSVK